MGTDSIATGKGRSNTRGAETARAAAGLGALTATALVMTTVLALATIAGARPAAAQDVTAECRCVDSDGNEIENCSCFRMWSGESGPFTMTSSMFRQPRARIGVSVGGPLDGDDRDDRGVRLREVTDGSPADEAGLRAGDVIVRVDGHSVFEPMDDDEGEQLWIALAGSPEVERFVRLIGDLEPGEPVEIEYLRDGESRRTTVTPEEAPRGATVWSGPGDAVRMFGWRGGEGRPLDSWSRDFDGPRVFRFRDGDEEPAWTLSLREGDEGLQMLGRGFDPCFAEAGRLMVVGGDRCVDGARLQTLNSQLAEYFGVEDGVLVLEVLGDGALGVQAGDVIVSIGDRAVEEASDVRRILSSYETDEPVTLTVVRKGERVQVRGTRREP